jgi:TonB family protein
MSARNKPYDQFGPYILFKKFEADALGELWRAGRIENGTLGPTVALRRLTGGNRGAVASNVQAVAPILPRISGSSFVRDQQAGVTDGVPWLSWEYAGGRSLRYVIDRSRGSKEHQPNPLPLDQAIVIAEKIALSLATMAELRDTNGTRFSHGALVPQFVWIGDDGEIRVAGQQLGSAMIASLADANVYADVARYFAPEYRVAPHGQKNADVYNLGAILFLLVTGQEPPDAATASAFVAAVRAAKTTAGEPVPDDIRVILDKSFNLDPSMRYASVGDMKQAISGLANSGRYSATTFNLAFYLSTLLKKEMDGEAAEREKEAAVDVAPYLEAPKPVAKPVAVAAAPAPAAAPTPAPAMFASQQQPPKSKLPLAIAAVVVLAAGGGAAWMMLGKSDAQPAAKPVQAQVVPAAAPAAKPPVQLEPIAVTATPATDTAAATTTAMTTDAEAQKKAFEEAVRLKLQAEMMKLQDNFMADLKKKQSKDAPVALAETPSPATTTQETRDEAAAAERMTAAQLDQRRLESREQQSAAGTTTPAPVVTQTVASAPAVAAPAPAPVRPAVREGDVVDLASLDSVPRRVTSIKPVYPPMAMRQKLTATIFLTVLVSEKGDVLDVRVLRGEERFGMNDAAIRAMRATRFSSPMKDGKRVRTWFPQTIEFKL